MRHDRHRSSRSPFLVALATLCALWLVAGQAFAAPQARILRIDPRASLDDGAPILTTVIDLVQHKPVSDITANCAHLTGNGNLDCVADALEQPQALYDPFKFPDKNAILTVTVDGRDVPGNFVSATRWKDAKGQEGVGTAFLILVDAAASMGSRLSEAKAVAKAFVNKMGPNDIIDIMAFNDRAVVKNSKWMSKKSQANAFIDSIPTFPAQGRTRPLFNIIKQAATDGFSELGNVGSTIVVPMHQTMVVLSNGVSGSDTGSPAQVALALKQYMTKGRFPEDNQTLPKAPVPIVSIWFPARQMEEFFQNARQFMENLANPEIGGYHSIIRRGQSQRAARIADAVSRRFDQLHLIKWRVPCIAPTVGQTFKLVFKNTNPPIAGDNFINVPVGIDPSTWPLDIDMDQTLAYAKKNKVHPGGDVKVFGNFCWGSDHKRAQLYMIPKNQPAPQSLKGRGVDEAKKAQKQLIASNMVGKAETAGDTFVDFEIPDTTKFLSGKGSKMSARLVVVDTRAYRSSAITADKIITLPAEKKPLNLLLIGGLTFGGVVLILLVVQIFRGGSRKSSRRSGGTPPPVVAGQPPGGYPPPPGPGGYPPPGGPPPPGGGGYGPR
jgi:hypothetical protein